MYYIEILLFRALENGRFLRLHVLYLSITYFVQIVKNYCSFLLRLLFLLLTFKYSTLIYLVTP